MPEQAIDFVFPPLGISVESETYTQPEGSSPDGTNVRLLDAIAERARGGSRFGLSRLIDEQVNGAHDMVQHLAVLYTTKEVAYNTDSKVGGCAELPAVWSSSPTTTDPSTNNDAAGLGDRNPLPRVVRTGGSGRQPIRLACPGLIEFYQAFGDSVVFPSGDQTYNFELNFDLEVQIDHTIFLCLGTDQSSANTNPSLTHTVKNLAGSDWTRLDSGEANAGFYRVTDVAANAEWSFAVWYKRIESEDDKTIVIAVSDSVTCEEMEFVFCELAGVADPPVRSHAFDTYFDLAIPVTSFDTAAISPEGTDGVIACYYARPDLPGPTFTPESGFVQRLAYAGNPTGVYWFDDYDHGADPGLVVSADCAPNDSVFFISVGIVLIPE